MMERLQKALAQHGVASRRAAEKLILAGRVLVNGAVAVLGQKVDATDEVRVDGRLLSGPEALIYIMLNKPRAVITTAKDTHERTTVLDLLPGLSSRVFPVGRLDKDTEGLLLLTNDGDLSNRLLHPAGQIAKCYAVTISGTLTHRDISWLQSGLELEDGKTLPAQVTDISRQTAGTTFCLTIYEGRKRQIRRMCAALGHEVVSLKRLSLGPLKLGELPLGQYRHLLQKEVADLFECVGVSRLA